MSTPHAARPRQLSLRRQLLLWLLLPQLVLWAGGGLLTYRIALSYAEKGIDQSLTQSVRALARQVKPVGSGLLIDFPRAAQDVLEQDPDDRISYMVSSPPGQFLLGNQRLPQPTEAPGGPGEPLLYGGLLDGKPLRIVAMDVRYGEGATPQTLRVQVGKGLAVQQRIARELVADMLAPLLALGVLLSLLVYGGIRRGLAPLTRLTAQLENRSVNALSPIGMTQAPSEVHALVLAINGLLGEVARRVDAGELRTTVGEHLGTINAANLRRGGGVTQRVDQVAAGLPVTSLLVDRSDRLWVGTAGQGVVCREAGGALVRWTRDHGLPSQFIRTFREDAQGTMWAGTSGGLVRWEGDRLFSFTRRHGLLDDPHLRRKAAPRRRAASRMLPCSV